MAESQHTAGIKIGGDASGVVDAAKDAEGALRKTREEGRRGSEQAKRNADESRRFVERLRDEASTVGKSRVELERYRASQLQLTDAQKKSVDSSLRQIQAYDKKAQAVRSLALAWTAGVAALVGYTTAVARATQQDEEAQNRLLAVLRATGYQAGLTKRELQELAATTQAGLGFDDAQVMNAQAGLLKFGNIHGQVFREAMRVSADLAAFMGTEITSAAEMVGKTLQSPTEGLMMMERNFGRLTEAEEHHIQTLVAQGRALEAQNAVLEIWRQRIGGVAAEMNTGITRSTKDLNNAWGDLLETVGKTETVGGYIQRGFSGAAEILKDVQREIEGTRTHLRGFFMEFPADFLAKLPGGMGILGRIGLTMAARERANVESAPQRRPAITVNDWMEPSPPSNVVLGGRVDPTTEAARRAAQKAHQAELLKIRETVALLDQRGLDWAEQALSVEVDHAKVEAARLQYATEQRRTQVELDTTLNQLRTDGVNWAEEALSVAEDHTMVVRQQIAAQEQARESYARAQAETTQILAEQARTAEREWQRTSDNIERSLTDAIMRGGQSGLEYLKAAFRTAILTPIISPIVRPFAQGMSSLMGGVTNSIFGGGFGGGGGFFSGAGGAAGAGLWATSGGAALASEAAALGIVETGAGGLIGGAGMGIGAALPWIGGGLLAANALGLFDGDGAAMRRGGVSAPFGQQGAWRNDAWFGNDMIPSLNAFTGGLATREQNIIRNLGLSSGEISRVNASLAPVNARQYAFGMEHTDWTQSMADEQIAADRLQAISQALGRSIEELTGVMAMSAEQWEAYIESGRQAIGNLVRTLPQQLGISGLESFQTSLGVSDVNAPLDRVAAARGAYSDVLARSRAGDLDAVRAFPGVAQQLLDVGRDTYASGGGFQELFSEVKSSLTSVLDQQRSLEIDLLRDLPASILESSRDQIQELRTQTKQLLGALQGVIRELHNVREAVS